jgi:DNA-binding NtrC family response regulator
LNILLADDDGNFGLALKKELEEDRHLVDLVANGVEAVLRFLNNTYDFVLLDLRMPRLGGTDALRIIKNINPRVPAITFSGDAGTAEIEESARCGAAKCLQKPFNVAQLREEIRNHPAK